MRHEPLAGFPAPAAPRIVVSHSPGEHWPRTGERGQARCFAFQCADVLEVWCDTVGKHVQPAFVTVLTASGKPAVLLPLGIEMHRAARVLRFLDSGVSDYNAPIAFPEISELGPDAAHEIWRQLQEHLPPFDVAVFEKMPGMIEDLPNPLLPLTVAQHPESCHFARLPDSWEKFAQERIPKAADSRRRRRKLEKVGTVKFEISDESGRGEFLDAMMRMKRRKFIDTKGQDMFEVTGSGEFYREMTHRCGAGPVQLSALSVDNRIIAAHWGYVAGDRFYHLMPAHEAGEWTSYAPGRLLNEWLMEWSIQRGLKFFDFGIGDEPYKFDYCDVHITLRDAFLPVTPKGQLYSAMLRLAGAAKRGLRDSWLGPASLALRNRWRSLKGAGQPS
jgi:CelD/BcsL family acetyltransferase involved in cellulose biosynthesis